MRVIALLLSLGCLCTSHPARAAGDQDLWRGKVKTDRSIRIERVVEAPADKVYQLWMSAEGIRSFFAPAARVEPVVGGRYELMFDPEHDPDGERDGTKGARILAIEPNRFLAFEWRGRQNMVEMNAQPLPTWVELHFAPVVGERGSTRISLEHYGFGTGGTWEEAYVFFQNAWKSVMGALEQRCLHLGGVAAPSKKTDVSTR
ncbi:MAG TPA: SRPBCC domain-containing protein [Thermoanaerobaculia bacterium]|nr:SRPBCC domain-containing protein [Thermoanaerobaculia bacterium]